MAAWLALARRRPLAAEVAALRERLEKLRSENDLLRARLDRIDPHARPHYRSWERLHILFHRQRYGLSIEGTAHAFAISGQTVINWLKEVESGVARLVLARRPMNALPDLVREVAVFLKRQWPRWGTRRIAGTLSRLGLRVSRTSVQRILRKPRPKRPAAAVRAARGALRPKGPNDVWLIDLTRVQGFFRSIIVGGVVDLFSRKIIVVRAWRGEPDSPEVCLLVRHAIERNGKKPRWIVTDQGAQFTARRFIGFLRRRRIRRRYGAVGRKNSIATIERFWRSMKDEFSDRLLPWAPIAAIRRRLSRYAAWFNGERVHQGLSLSTPDEVHGGRPFRPGPARAHGTLEVRLLGGDRRLPVLRLREAA